MLHFTIMFSVLNLQAFENLGLHYLERGTTIRGKCQCKCLHCELYGEVCRFLLFKYKKYFRLTVILCFLILRSLLVECSLIRKVNKYTKITSVEILVIQAKIVFSELI